MSVKSGHNDKLARCPLYPEKRTFAVQLGYVRFVPIADIAPFRGASYVDGWCGRNH